MESSEIKICCKYSEMVPIESLKPHPENENIHPDDQIKMLTKVIRHLGFRHPIIVSNQSGFIAAGHARLIVAKILGMKSVPVDYQDFETEDEEFTFRVADNAIGLQSELNMAAIQLKTLSMDGATFDTDWLGIKDFFLPNVTNDGPKTKEDQRMCPVECPECGAVFEV